MSGSAGVVCSWSLLFTAIIAAVRQKFHLSSCPDFRDRLYPQYENDYKRVIADAKIILEGLKTDESENRTFTLFYHSVPAYACAVLVRDEFERLNPKEREFCKDVLIDYASMPRMDGYRYQVGERFDYAIRRRFFEKLSHFVLTCDKRDIQPYLRPFLALFSGSREVADILSEFVSAEDKLHQYDQFWAVWDLFYPNIKTLCEREGGRSYSSSVVHNYLLAWPYWKKNIREWRSLKSREKAFFSKVAEEIGGHPAVLYSLAKLLNEIGSGFVEDGIAWISGIIERTPGLSTRELEVNTVYYLENLMHDYVLSNRHKVRTTPQIQQKVLTILNFLLEKGSATAYLLREDIL